MYKGLYDNFAHWFHDGRGQVWFYSDPHFSDEEMKYLRANYIGDEEQVKRINSKVGKYDTLVILGDIGNLEYVKKLHGYKVLVMGNHDSGATNYKRDMIYLKDYPDYESAQKALNREIDHLKLDWDTSAVHGYKDNHLFDEVYEGALIISEKLILSHEPINFPYALNIHGHDHSLWSKADDMHWNVCAEHINYMPICLKNIIQSGKLKNIPTIHREIIDMATARKKKREGRNGK